LDPSYRELLLLFRVAPISLDTRTSDDDDFDFEPDFDPFDLDLDSDCWDRSIAPAIGRPTVDVSLDREGRPLEHLDLDLDGVAGSPLDLRSGKSTR